MRALQGACGALMIPQGFGLLKEVFDDDAEFDKATGLFGPATGVALLAAPIVAGALVDANLWGTGWRLVFLNDVPIGALMLPLAIRSLPRGRSGRARPGTCWDGAQCRRLPTTAGPKPGSRGVRGDSWRVSFLAV